MSEINNGQGDVTKIDKVGPYQVSGIRADIVSYYRSLMDYFTRRLMRILFANGRQTYPLFQGGDGISMHNLLSRLYQDQHQVLHIGKLDPPHIEQANIKH